MRSGIKAVRDDIQKDLQGKLNRANTIDAYLNTALFRQWQKAQMERWMTENSSEGERWLPVDPESPYGKRKPIKYASYPGGGNVTMVATGKLMTAATGRGVGFLKQVSSRRAVFGVSMSDVPYAAYAAEDRPFMEISERTEEAFRKGISKYLMRGVE